MDLTPKSAFSQNIVPSNYFNKSNYGTQSRGKGLKRGQDEEGAPRSDSRDKGPMPALRRGKKPKTLASMSDDDDDMEYEWKCKSCRTINPDNFDSCETCDKPREICPKCSRPWDQNECICGYASSSPERTPPRTAPGSYQSTQGTSSSYTQQLHPRSPAEAPTVSTRPLTSVTHPVPAPSTVPIATRVQDTSSPHDDDVSEDDVDGVPTQHQAPSAQQHSDEEDAGENDEVWTCPSCRTETNGGFCRKCFVKRPNSS